MVGGRETKILPVINMEPPEQGVSVMLMNIFVMLNVKGYSPHLAVCMRYSFVRYGSIYQEC